MVVLFPRSPDHEENKWHCKSLYHPSHQELEAQEWVWKMLATSSSRAGGNYAVISAPPISEFLQAWGEVTMTVGPTESPWG